MAEWHADVDFAGTVSDDEAVAFAECTERFTTVTVDRAEGRVRFGFSVDARTLQLATVMALQHARRVAAGSIGAPVAVHVLPFHDLVREVSRPSYPPLLNLSGVARRLGVSHERARQLRDERDDFPPAVARLNGGGPEIYEESMIDAFVERWPRRVGRPSTGSTVDGQLTGP